jgi:hypothetical protein
MKSSIKTDPKSIRDIAYYQQRYRNRVFYALVAWVSEQAQNQNLTQKDIAGRIRKDPAVISRLLNNPSNLTLDTISDVLLAFDAEAEPPEIVFFRDRRPPNYIHPLMVKALNITSSQNVEQTQSTTTGNKILRVPTSYDLRIEITATTGAG